MSNQITRRSLVSSIGAMSIASLAGCSNSSSSSETTSTTSNTATENVPEAFEDISVDGTELSVALTDREVADTIALVYKGEEVDSIDVATTKRASFDIGIGYTPGEHTVQAIKGDEVVGETDVDLSPEIELVNAGLGKNYPDKVPTRIPEAHLFFEIENVGTAADRPTKLVSPDTPYTVPEGYHGFDNETGEEEQPILEPGSTTVVYSQSLFAKPGIQEDWTCGQMHSMDVTIRFKHSDPIEKTYEFESAVESEEYDSRDQPLKLVDSDCKTGELTPTE